MLNANKCNLIIKYEILYLTSKDKRNEVLLKYFDYIGKLGEFSDDHLWGAITFQPINW